MKKFLPLALVLLAAAFPFEAPASEAASAGVEAVAPEASVRVVHSGFEVHNPGSEPCPVEVYSLTGRQVMNADAPSGVTTYNLAPGHYIVRVGSKATKIVVGK